FVFFRRRLYSEAPKIMMAESVVRKRTKPINRWNWVEFCKPFCRKTSRIAQGPEYTSYDIVLCGASRRCVGRITRYHSLVSEYAIPVMLSPDLQSSVKVKMIFLRPIQ